MEHSMEESSTAPLPSTTTPPQQQLPNSKCPNTSATNLQASEASHTARVSWACGCRSCLNNDIRRTISPRSNLPSRRYFRSTTQRRLLTLSRPWQIGRHLRRQQPLSSHFSSSPTCPPRRHTFNVPVLHVLYTVQTRTHGQAPKLTSHSRTTEIVLHKIVPALLARVINSAHRHGHAESRSAQAATMQAGKSHAVNVRREQNTVRMECDERQG